MKPKTKKHVEKIHVEVKGEMLTISGRGFRLQWTPEGLTYIGDIRKVDRAIELFRKTKEVAGLGFYKLGDAINLTEGEEVTQEDQPIS